MGLSAREMLSSLIAGQDDPQYLAQLARGRMRSKIVALERAHSSQIADHHRQLLSLHLRHIDTLTEVIEQLTDAIDEHLKPFDQDEEIDRLDEIPGIGLQVAQTIIAELGTDMSRFPTAAMPSLGLA